MLLGGEAGLRCGEMIALEWTDVDLGNRKVCIRRSDWNGQATTPKGGRLRHVPLTRRLTAALSEHRHLRSARVLCQDDTEPLTRQIVQTRAKRAARKAALMHGGVHILRHKFCSHLAMRGAPPRAIQELAGHRELGMTQRFMHLSPAFGCSTNRDANVVLDDRAAGLTVSDAPRLQKFGDGVETRPRRTIE